MLKDQPTSLASLTITGGDGHNYTLSVVLISNSGTRNSSQLGTLVDAANNQSGVALDYSSEDEPLSVLANIIHGIVFEPPAGYTGSDIAVRLTFTQEARKRRLASVFPITVTFHISEQSGAQETPAPGQAGGTNHTPAIIGGVIGGFFGMLFIVIAAGMLLKRQEQVQPGDHNRPRDNQVGVL